MLLNFNKISRRSAHGPRRSRNKKEYVAKQKAMHVFDILHDCVNKSCVCQLSLNEYMMMMIMAFCELPFRAA